MVVVDGDKVVARWRVDDPARPDLSMVETMARLHLAARRIGLDLRLEHPSTELWGLVELVGLADLLLDARWQAEGPEQLRVEKVMKPGDPVA
ncbi:MAG: hypothetical protein M3Z84_02380 [Actinomycetota bacterium]|nr:hypothetical protein [Actinomycetota bacterium]